MDVRIRLLNKELWDQFHGCTTEMIVTKTGRKMFPKLEYAVEGMDPTSSYGIVLQMEQIDDNRYKFSNGEWSPSGRGEMVSPPRSVAHHDGVMQGSQWMRAPVHFERVKITNNPQDNNPSHIYLHSMHKYVPTVSVYLLTTNQETPFLTTALPSHKLVARARLDCTEFIAVTAYQNERIKELKIEHNPFAKGFREGADRKRSSPLSSEPSPKRTPTIGDPISPVPVIPMFNPLWYSAYWNPYIFNPLLSPYRFDFAKQ